MSLPVAPVLSLIPPRRALLDTLELEAEMGSALDRGEFELRYQPIVELVTGRLRGAEALLRWRHPRRGLLGPAAFIETAEQTGLIVPIGRFVLREALAQLRRWQDGHPGDPPLAINVNVSGRQLEDPRFVDDVAGAIRHARVAPGSVVLEITEGVLVRDGAMLQRLHALRALGVGLAIDDFGTGYSNLSALHRYPVDTFKLDRSLTDALLDGPKGEQIAGSALRLAAALGLDVVAEGIERPEHLRALLRWGCRLGQGYLLAEPLPAGQVEALMAESLPVCIS